MSAPKLTPWFRPSTHPARIGVYQRKIDGVTLTWSRWDGVRWRKNRGSLEEAARTREFSWYQTGGFRWRGLAEEPKS